MSQCKTTHITKGESEMVLSDYIFHKFLEHFCFHPAVVNTCIY